MYDFNVASLAAASSMSLPSSRVGVGVIIKLFTVSESTSNGITHSKMADYDS